MWLSDTAFDTIGLCAFNFRFNEFYSDEAHPFAKQMAETLVESGKRANRTTIGNYMHRRDEQRRQENIAKMWDLCDKIIAERKKNPQPDVNDVLNVMLGVNDGENEGSLDQENIRYNMTTFLVYYTVGHELNMANLCRLPDTKQPVRHCHFFTTISSKIRINYTRRSNKLMKSSGMIPWS